VQTAITNPIDIDQDLKACAQDSLKNGLLSALKSYKPGLALSIPTFSPYADNTSQQGFHQLPLSVLIFCAINDVKGLDITGHNDIQLKGLEKLPSLLILWCTGCGFNDAHAGNVMPHLTHIRQIFVEHTSEQAARWIEPANQLETHLKEATIVQKCGNVQCESGCHSKESA
jgi:hypothetical protein